MEAKIGRFFESVGTFFTGSDDLPWSDGEMIATCEKDAAESDSDRKMSENLLKLSWALVHSKRPHDVQRGIAMLEASLENDKSTVLEKREKLYLVAIGCFRSGDYSRSRSLTECCLEMQPDWRQALSLKKMVEDRIAKDGVIGIGIAGAVGIAVAGIGLALARDVFDCLVELDTDYKEAPTQEEWQKGSKVCQCLKIFYSITLRFSRTNYVV